MDNGLYVLEYFLRLFVDKDSELCIRFRKEVYDCHVTASD
jgi:hypothetical protein